MVPRVQVENGFDVVLSVGSVFWTFIAKRRQALFSEKLVEVRVEEVQ